VEARHGHVATATASLSLSPWGAAALEAARRGPGLLALVVDAASSDAAAAFGRADWAQAILRASGLAEPICVAVDRDADPTVALRARWTLRLFELAEDTPHAAIYAVRRRDGRLLPLFAASRESSMAVDEPRGAELRRALAASARRGRRARPPTARDLAAAVAVVKAAYDPTRPEFRAAPGPLRPSALALLRVAARQGDDAAAALARETLGAMARGGVRDQLDGGFFRAVRDAGWRLPDFVRTAVLNAALLDVYASAAAEFGEPSFADVACGSARYVLETLRDPKTGAVFTGQAADETYYTWTSREVTSALPVSHVQAACMHWNVQPAARIVSDPLKNVLYVAADAEAIARDVDQPVSTVARQLDDARVQLLAARAARATPRLDRSHYVDVNAQVVCALLAGARSLGEPAWQARALETLGWLEEVCFTGGTPVIPHRAAEESAPADAYLGDYAALGRALLAARACTGDPRYLERAEAVTTALLAQFRDPGSGALLDVARESLVSRVFWPEQPLEDLGGPSPAATAIRLLIDLARRTGRTRYRRAATEALRSAARAAAEDPLAAAGYYVALGEWLGRGI